MDITPRSRRQLRLQNLAFLVLFLALIGLLGWLAQRHYLVADWTAAGRNTLSQASRELTASLEGPVEVTAYARENEALRRHIRELVGRYQRLKPDFALEFINPDTVPEQVRELGISAEGSLVLRYQGRQEVLANPAEQAITNALYRMARRGDRWLVFLAGHGERDPAGEANHDLGDWTRRLAQTGLKAQQVNLAATGAIPDNTTALVVAGPATDLLPGEADLIRGYLDRGGNLLWLGDPGPLHGLESLAESLGVRFLPGSIVDATTQLFGIGDPAFALVTGYPPHPVTAGLQATSLFPQAAALEVEPGGPWQATPVLETQVRSWTELGGLEGEVRYDEGTDERPGPLLLGVALTRPLDAAPGAAGGEQRVLVIGDGDFLSNSYLGNGANLDLGLAAMNWLAGDDRLVAIPTRIAPDLSLELSTAASIGIVVVFLLLLPLGLITAGLTLWWRRRRR